MTAATELVMPRSMPMTKRRKKKKRGKEEKGTGAYN
jgi:hypothetical protein